ncbi:uncharacterized protein BYT42DRAFT_546168 [Radiomyces spectabilis]|uniref:uncharacterized protein n=1 Tax=Radiomyces spectabilis TaxID=64574 RepID=UPI00221EE89E|nr:uncharacterized protein BYT42DRAFT_546168 [Radiomyces spectabilis]KAI8377472.1 hypothetical protein BYT42DRAFT_546168 [Radiomyces spectabilis]
MPPKPNSSKYKKPLTSLDRKAKKKKAELIHKATVKSQYYKTIAKEKDVLEAPDYVKEIFGERTIDDQGNVVEYEAAKGVKRKAKATDDVKEDEKVFYLDESSSSEEEDDEQEQGKAKQKKDVKGKGKQEKKNENKRSKPNPFKEQMERREKERQEALQKRAEREEEYQAKNKARKQYYKERNRERGKMLAKNSKGQPNMATQMEILLGKIKKQVSK